MANIAIDVGKRKSYFAVEQDGSVVQECYVKTDRESFFAVIKDYPGSKKARIAAARYMLRAIYYMLKWRQNYDEYLKKRGGLN